MLEPLPAHRHHHDAPRASLLSPAGELATTAIWMGGAHTPHGHPIALKGLASAWVIDCAGDMPAAYRAAAGRWFSRVFPDLDHVPPAFAAISGLADEVAALIEAKAGAPSHLYVVCQHGMNRSGLVAGLVMRRLGLDGAAAVDRITAARPGALSNQAFRRIVVGEGTGRLS